MGHGYKQHRGHSHGKRRLLFDYNCWGEGGGGGGVIMLILRLFTLVTSHDDFTTHS